MSSTLLPAHTSRELLLPPRPPVPGVSASVVSFGGQGLNLMVANSPQLQVTQIVGVTLSFGLVCSLDQVSPQHSERPRRVGVET